MNIKDLNINGPMNLIKLIKNNKVIYLFADLNRDYITQCNKEKDNIDIDNFFITYFKENNKNNINFFFEKNYLNKFQHSFLYKVNDLYKNKINNIKFHNINFINLSYFYNYINNYFNNLNSDFLIGILNNLISSIKQLKKYIKNSKFIIKLLNNFKNKELKKKINKLYNDFFIKIIFEIINDANQLIDYIKENKTNLLYYKNINNSYYDINKNIYSKNYYICEKIDLLINSLSSLYLIKTILDTNSIKNSICYLEYKLFNIVLLILVSVFDFEIVNKYYSDPEVDKDNIKLTNKIIKSLEYRDINVYNFLYKYLSYERNGLIIQCINFDNFNNYFY